ncbi:MAG TPA: DJ-1/PfpI family protein [Lacunisphaera sp.]|nr:DJ-1/PfpI family protein [Lacunisphaera sp.]
MKRHVAILLFEEVEILDFAGPFEVFAATNELNGFEVFHTFTVAELPGSIRTRNGLKVVPDFTLESAPQPHILLVPGGSGTRPLLRKASMLEWVRQRARKAELVASVCTGSLLLAQAGLLHNLRATTHHEAIAELAALAPNTDVVKDVRFVDNGQVLTAAGISAGIDLCLHIVARLHGMATARRTADYMEYRWLHEKGSQA